MGVAQMGCGFLAVATVTKVIEKKSAELAQPRPEHAAVEALSKREAALYQAYSEVTCFSKLCCCWKVIISVAAAAQLFSGFLFAMAGEYCFRSFSVSSRINDPYEDNGLKDPDGNASAFNIVLLPGKGALGIFAFGVLLHIIFAKGTARLAKTRLAEKSKEPCPSPVQEIAKEEPLVEDVS